MNNLITKKINVSGIVQGVGFRPFVYNLAKKLNIYGYVLNDNNGVEIVAQGQLKDINLFLKSIKDNSPPNAIIDKINIVNLDYNDFNNFIIKKINTENEKNVSVSPDLAVCDDCLKELLDPENRRFYYPFINCTNCGPRFTIINDIPYDRINTTMNEFTMCKDCYYEYNDPKNRRFHAQPNACHNCGPKLLFYDNNKNIIKKGNDAQSIRDLIDLIARMIGEGRIIAIKGLGGYHLACDASNEKVVSVLREKKLRRKKPFAVMVKDIGFLKLVAETSDAELTRIQNIDRPILLLKKKGDIIAPSVAPNINEIGIMLPYTPLQYLIFNQIDVPLIMTSANLSDDPIIYKDEDALNNIKDLYDYILIGERRINTYCDDSVLRLVDNKTYFIRRSRGITPVTLKLNKVFNKQILALGAEQKNTFCFIKNDIAYLSHHVGDLKSPKSFDSYKESIKNYTGLFDLDPQIIAHDLHPQYLSSQFADSEDDIVKTKKKYPIQHHHAHIAACMADNNLEGQVLGVALDGTGLGDDGTIWGGELLISSYKEYKRVGTILPVDLPGLEVSIKNIWRMGLAYLYHVYKDKWKRYLPAHYKKIDENNLEMLVYQLTKRYNNIQTTSCGRLFDGVASLSGLMSSVNYEGQAAIELEHIAKKSKKYYTFNLIKKNYINYISWEQMIDQLLYDVKNDIKIDLISYKFHYGFIKALKELIIKILSDYNLINVVLSGGCFMNIILLNNLKNDLINEGINVFIHRNIPCNDGGLSLGQAVIAGYINEGAM